MAVARYIRIDPKSLPFMKRLTNWVIHPQSRLYRLWKPIVLLSIYVTVMMEPYASAFNRRDHYKFTLYFADIIYLIDVLFRFHVPYIEDHVYVMDVRKISWNYLESEFWIDFAALVPIEVISPMFQSNISFWILRANRLIRVYRIFRFFSEQEEKLSASILLFAVKFSFLISLVCHWFTCVLFLLGYTITSCPTECRLGDTIDQKWPSTALPYYDIREASTVSKYVTSLYFAVYSLTSVGYGHLRPVNNSERWAMIFGLGVCNFTFGYCTGIITSLLVNYRSIQFQYELKVQAVRDFMMQRSFPEDLQSRIIDYYMYLWMRTGGIDAFGLLQQLPPAFNAEVVLQINHNFLRKVTIFNGASKRFLMTLSRALKPAVFLPGDLIIHAGDVGQEMYFICRGKVEIISDDLKSVYDAMGDGCFFGEIALIKGTPRINHVLAATHCDIRVLSKNDLALILDQFPDMAERFFLKAEERYRIHLLRTDPKLYSDYQVAQAKATSNSDSASGFTGRTKIQFPTMAARSQHTANMQGNSTNVPSESPLVESVPNPLSIHIAPTATNSLTEVVRNAAELMVTNLAHPTQLATNIANISESMATNIIHSSTAVATNLVQTSANLASTIATNLANPQLMASNLVQSSTSFANTIAHNLANPSELASNLANPIATATARMRSLTTSTDLYNLPHGVGIQSALTARKAVLGTSSNKASHPGFSSNGNQNHPPRSFADNEHTYLSTVSGPNTSTGLISLPRFFGNEQISIPSHPNHSKRGATAKAFTLSRPQQSAAALSQADFNSHNAHSTRSMNLGSTSSQLTSRRKQPAEQQGMLIGSNNQRNPDPFAPARFM